MPLWLDLGPVGQQVPPGWVDCTPEDCGPQARFVQPPHDALPGVWPDPMAGDALHGGVLQLDVPAGAYRLWAWTGHGIPELDDVVSPVALSVGTTTVGTDPGRETWSAFAAAPDLRCWPRYVRSGDDASTPLHTQTALPPGLSAAPVVAGPSGIRLRVTGRPLQGLVLAREDETDVVLAQLEVEDALRRAWREDHLPPVRPPPAPPSAGIATGRLEVGPTEPVERPVQRALWRDDRRTVGFWLPTDAAATVTVKAPPDVGVTLWELGWLDARQHTSRPRATRPTWLVPTEGSLRGGQGLPAGVALTVHAPVDAKLGRHRVVVTLTQGAAVYRVRLDVDVLDGVLPASSLHTGWFHQHDPAKVRLDGPRDAAFLRDLQRARSLGADAAAVKGLMWGTRFPEGVAEGAQRFEDVRDAWATMGGTTLLWGDPKEPVRPLTYLNGSGHLPEALQAPLRTLLAAAPHPALDVAVTFWEEEGGWKNATAERLAERLVPDLRALHPGLPLAATAGHPMDRAVAGLFDVLLVGNLPALSKATLDGVRAAGSRAWAYNAAPGATGPLVAWAAGADALLQWHWDPTEVDPCDDSSAQPPWWYASELPGEVLAHTTLAESMAQGIRITRLLTALQPSCAAQSNSPTVARACALVEAARSALDGATPSTAFDGEVWPAAQVDALEASATEALRALRR